MTAPINTATVTSIKRPENAKTKIAGRQAAGIIGCGDSDGRPIAHTPMNAVTTPRTTTIIVANPNCPASL